MKILHIWDVSGVANTIAKFMDRHYGTRSSLIVRKKFDRFGFTTQGRTVNDGPITYGVRCLWAAKDYDLIHVHNWAKIVRFLRWFYGKPIVLTIHNMSARNQFLEVYPRGIDVITVTSRYLLEQCPRAILTPVPVDTDLFYDRGEHEPQTALHSDFWATEEAFAYAKERDLVLTRLYRHSSPIPHSEMPVLLNQFEYYIDVKRSPSMSPDIIPSLSKTGLEALACGLKVIRWDGKMIQGLPEESRPENVAKKFFDLYNNVLGGGWSEDTSA